MFEYMEKVKVTHAVQWNGTEAGLQLIYEFSRQFDLNLMVTYTLVWSEVSGRTSCAKIDAQSRDYFKDSEMTIYEDDWIVLISDGSFCSMSDRSFQERYVKKENQDD